VQISEVDKQSDLEKLAVRDVPCTEEADAMPPLIQVCFWIRIVTVKLTLYLLIHQFATILTGNIDGYCAVNHNNVV